MNENSPNWGRELDRHIMGFYDTDNPLSPYYVERDRDQGDMDESDYADSLRDDPPDFSHEYA